MNRLESIHRQIDFLILDTSEIFHDIWKNVCDYKNQHELVEGPRNFDEVNPLTPLLNFKYFI